MNQRLRRTPPGPEHHSAAAGRVDASDHSAGRDASGEGTPGDRAGEVADGCAGDRGGTETGGEWTFRWTVAGVAAVLGAAVVRLGARAVDTLRTGLTSPEWIALALLTALFVYGEGIRALERRWVPFVVDRARSVSERALPWRLLGPLYAMALVGTSGRLLARAWAGVAAVVTAVLLVHALPEPWRGVVDFAVAAALLWGVIALLRALVRGWR